jgi:hypothetical protein
MHIAEPEPRMDKRTQELRLLATFSAFCCGMTLSVGSESLGIGLFTAVFSGFAAFALIMSSSRK